MHLKATTVRITLTRADIMAMIQEVIDDDPYHRLHPVLPNAASIDVLDFNWEGDEIVVDVRASDEVE